MQRRTSLVPFSALLPLLALFACKRDDAPEPPTWEDATVEHAWHREGYGEGFALAATDLDGDGSDEILYGGRGLAAVHAGARAHHTPLWTLPWPKEGPATRGGDNDWVYAIHLVDVNDDGVADPIVLDSQAHATAVNGADGAVLWHTVLDAEFLTVRTALFDADGDDVPDFFPSGGRTAYAGKTGEALWSVDTPMPISFIARAELDGAAGEDVLLVREIDEIIGWGEHLPTSELIEPEVTVYAYTGDGTLLWAHAPVSNPLWATVGDLDGDGIHEAVIGQQEGLEVVWADGSGWWRAIDGLVWEVAAADFTGDGNDEIVAMVSGWSGTTVQVWRGDGELLQEVALDGEFFALHLADLDDDGVVEALVGHGDPWGSPPFGFVTALTLGDDEKDTVRWSQDTFNVPNAIATAHVDGEDVVVVGGMAARLLALSPETGAPRWQWTSGHFVTHVAAIDLDGDGVDEVLSGDVAGHLIATSSVDGRQLWATRLDVGADGMVTGIAVDDIDADGTPDIVVTAHRYFQAQIGLLARLDVHGDVVFSKRVGSWLVAPHLVDLDGDGTLEIVAGDEGLGRCGVRAYASDGAARWHREIGDCIVAMIDVADANGDGVPEIAYADNHWVLPVNAALLGPDGAVIWHQPVGDSDSLWVALGDGGYLHGGFALDDEGHVTRRRLSDGAIAWRHTLDSAPDPEGEHWRISGGSNFGVLGPDLDGDGKRELLTSNHTGEASLLDGATGAARWTLRIEEDGLPWNVRHEGFAPAWVPPTATVPGWFALGEHSLQRSRSRALAVDVDGELLGTWEMDGWGSSAVPTSWGAAIGGGLGVHALKAE